MTHLIPSGVHLNKSECGYLEHTAPAALELCSVVQQCNGLLHIWQPHMEYWKPSQVFKGFKEKDADIQQSKVRTVQLNETR